MTGKRSMDDLNMTGKRVFMRVDFNVPIQNGQVADDKRIQAALPSIRAVIENNGKLILASHLGDPKNGPNPAFSLKPIAERLSLLIDRPVVLAPDCIGESVGLLISQMQNGDVLLLENLRFHAGEKKNDPVFAKALAEHIDVYINNAFGACHRAHASIVGLPALVPESAAGHLILKEVEYLDTAIQFPRRPLYALLGGAKVSGKLALIKNFLPKVDGILIGGAMSYTFMKALGNEIGKSPVEYDLIETALEILLLAEENDKLFQLPLDTVIAPFPEPGVPHRIVEAGTIPPDMEGFDIGPETIKLYSHYLQKAGTVIWNGPMGMFEIPEFSTGTFTLARVLAESDAISIVGGGDSASAMRKAGVADKMTHISTGGGASLEYLEGKELPGIAALPNT